MQANPWYSLLCYDRTKHDELKKNLSLLMGVGDNNIETCRARMCILSKDIITHDKVVTALGSPKYGVKINKLSLIWGQESFEKLPPDAVAWLDDQKVAILPQTTAQGKKILFIFPDKSIQAKFRRKISQVSP